METTSRWLAERIANVHETNGILTSAQVETLQQDLFLLRYNLMCHACRYKWATFNNGGTFELSPTARKAS